MSVNERAKEEKEEARNYPEYIAEGYFIDITEQILLYMGKNEISRSELAERMGVSRGYISKLFADNTNLTLLTLAKISKALDISWLFKLLPSRAAYPIGSHYWEDLLGESKAQFAEYTETEGTGSAPEVEETYIFKLAENSGSSGN